MGKGGGHVNFLFSNVRTNFGLIYCCSPPLTANPTPTYVCKYSTIFNKTPLNYCACSRYMLALYECRSQSQQRCKRSAAGSSSQGFSIITLLFLPLLPGCWSNFTPPPSPPSFQWQTNVSIYRVRSSRPVFFHVPRERKSPDRGRALMLPLPEKKGKQSNNEKGEWGTIRQGENE